MPIDRRPLTGVSIVALGVLTFAALAANAVFDVVSRM